MESQGRPWWDTFEAASGDSGPASTERPTKLPITPPGSIDILANDGRTRSDSPDLISRKLTTQMPLTPPLSSAGSATSAESGDRLVVPEAQLFHASEVIASSSDVPDRLCALSIRETRLLIAAAQSPKSALLADCPRRRSISRGGSAITMNVANSGFFAPMSAYVLFRLALA